MKRKFPVVLAAILVVSMLFAACGSKDGGSASSADKPAESSTVAESAAEASEVSEAVSESTAQTEPSAQEDKHLDVAIYWNATLDPTDGWGGWWTMRYGVGETLLTMNKDMELEECLADSYEVVNPQTFRFHIRQGVKFSNGNELTPQIVADTITMTAEKNSRGGNLKLESAEVDGEYVIFKTTEPYSGFPFMLTEPMCIIVDTTVDMSDYATNPICTGPYKAIGYVPDEKWELEANEYYWKGVPSIKYITNHNIGADTRIQSMMAGDIAMAYSPSTATLSLIEGSDQYKIISAVGTRESDIAINCREGRPTADKNLRLALAYALNRDVLAQIAGNGTADPLSKPFPDSTGYDMSKVTGPDYDVALAKDYLAKAGYEDKDGNGYVEKDGEELVLSILISSSSGTEVYQSMIDMWKAVGIHAELDPLENVKDKRSSGDFDILANAGWQTMNNGDGQSYMLNRWTDAGTDNYAGYHSDEFEAIMTKINETFNLEERAALFSDAAQIIADDCPAIFFAATANYDVINTAVLNDIEIYPIDYYVIDNTWEMK